MIEIEKTYLAKTLPRGLEKCKKEELIDVYVPPTAHHPSLRIRKKGTRYEITKKQPLANDYSQQKEQTIPLTQEEFNSLATVEGKRVHKIRHFFPYKGRIAEIDIFQEALVGLVLVDVEFDQLEEKDGFAMPEFCLAEVTQEKFLAGGMLCGKSFEDIEQQLKKFRYVKLQSC